MKNYFTLKLQSTVTILTLLLFTGCGTLSLQLDSKMTQSIFLNNLKPIKTIYLVKTNTAIVDDNIALLTKEKLLKRNYTFVNNPVNATYILRINTININKRKDQKELESGAITGVSTGLAIGATKGLEDGLAGGLIMGVVGGIFAYAVADGQIRMQADILITEKIGSKKINHLTRVIAEAKQVHLTSKEGQPLLEEKISKQISGIFL